MSELPSLIDRAKGRLLTNGAGKAGFLRGYQLGAKEALELFMKKCLDDIEVEYTQIVTVIRMKQFIEEVLK